MARYTTLKLAVRGRIATITLNRPERLNAIDDRMPAEIEAAVTAANDDARVHAIVLQGAGSAFCAGYDLKFYAEHAHEANQPMPWQPMRDYALMKRNTEQFMSLWRSHKPTIAKVHGYAVAGGSDIALCCDLLVMADEARIGYMPARVGLPDDRDVGLPRRRDARQAAAVHRRPDRRAHRRRLGAGDAGGAR